MHRARFVKSLAQFVVVCFAFGVLLHRYLLCSLVLLASERIAILTVFLSLSRKLGKLLPFRAQLRSATLQLCRSLWSCRVGCGSYHAMLVWRSARFCRLLAASLQRTLSHHDRMPCDLHVADLLRHCCIREPSLVCNSCLSWADISASHNGYNEG